MTLPKPLFEGHSYEVPYTEGIKYAGSKLKLIPHILDLVAKVGPSTVLDGFAGTTRLSQALAKRGYTVYCNDIAVWSEVFGRCYLLNDKTPTDYQPLIDHLNAVEPSDGWFTEHYGGYPNAGCSVQDDGCKKPWQIHNTRKLDAIREEIETLNLGRTEKAVALTSLIIALDQVDNNLGHFASYLRQWAPRSYKNMVLKVPRVFTTALGNRVYQEDIFDLLSEVTVDLAYFDPPYGSNNDKMPASRVRYASYYHVWTSIICNDKPSLFGKANRRMDTSDPVAASIFEEFRRNKDGRFIAMEAIENLIAATQARWIILSYGSGGRATAQELDEAMHQHGKLCEVVEIDYQQNVMASMKWTNEWLRDAEQPNKEFLFLLDRQ